MEGGTVLIGERYFCNILMYMKRRIRIDVDEEKQSVFNYVFSGIY